MAQLSTCGSNMQVEAKYKVLWADHGDGISNQYAGTGALKSGFTRTGKRTYGGLVDDGIKSLTRYYLNNFSDGRKQDAFDLVTGTYSIDKGLPVDMCTACGACCSAFLCPFEVGALQARRGWARRMSLGAFCA